MAIEAYSNQVEIPGIASIIHEDPINQSTHANHCELSATTILAVYNDVTNSKGMVVIGTRVSDFAIEWGTAVEFYNGAVEYVIPVRVSDTKFAIVYSHASDHDGYVIAGTVSGTVPTLGTEVEFADATTCYNIGAVLMYTDKIMIAYQNATTNQKVIIASLTGTSIALGSAATINSTIDSAAYTTLTQLCKHSTTLATVVYRVSATVTETVTITVSGTTITVNTGEKAAFGGSADIRYPSIGALNATKFVVAYTDITDTNKGNAQVGTITSTTITAGASEYVFDSASLATRVPTVAVISDTLFAVVYGASANAVSSKIGSVAGTAITFGSELAIASGNSYQYPTRYSSTPIRITYTKSGQLTFSYLNQYLNQFICGMLSQNYTTINIASMCHELASASTGEQIEISSLYLKSNGYVGFKCTDNVSTDNTGSLYLNGTLSSNKFYSTSDTHVSTSNLTHRKTVRLSMSNEPIILTEGQSLYASIDFNQYNFSDKGSCTVFGLKRS